LNLEEEIKKGYFTIESYGGNYEKFYGSFLNYFTGEDLRDSFQTLVVEVPNSDLEEILAICVDKVIKWNPTN